MNWPDVLPLNQSLPRELRAGDAHAWTVQTYLPAGLSVFLVLTGVINGTPTRLFLGGTPATTRSTPTPATGTAVASDGTVAFDIAGTASAAWLPGRYQWAAFSLDGSGNRAQIAEGTTIILPDPAGPTPVDPRSPNQRMYDAIGAMLQGKALDDVAMYKINNRELTKYTIAELENWRGIYARRVREERIRAGQKVQSNTIGIVFGEAAE